MAKQEYVGLSRFGKIIFQRKKRSLGHGGYCGLLFLEPMISHLFSTRMLILLPSSHWIGPSGTLSSVLASRVKLVNN